MNNIEVTGIVMRHQFKVPDMTCGGCAAGIRRALNQFGEAVVEIKVDSQNVTIDSDRSDEELSKIIQDAGFSPEPILLA